MEAVPPVEETTASVSTQEFIALTTGPDGAVAVSSANGLVGTGFASRYRLQPRAGF